MDQKDKKSIFKEVNMRIFLPPACILLAFVLWGSFAGESFSHAANSGLIWVEKYFSWFLSPISFIMVLFCLWAAFSKYGKIKLGGEDAVPKMSKLVWFAIALTSGIATGINFYGVQEPVNLFYNPPAFLTDVAPLSAEALTYAMRYSFLHWCLHPYAIYTAAGVSLVFMYFNGKRRYRVSDSLYPLLGDKINGKWGDLIDALAIFVIVGGVATSLGISVLQISRGADYLFGFASNPINWLILIVVMTLIYVVSSISGLHKGIAAISNLNTFLYFFVLIFAFFLIDPLGIMDVLITSLGDYIQTFVSTSLYMEPIQRTNWANENNIFYFTWFMVYAPVIGLFLVKLAYGRTIREFVTVNLIAPTCFVAVWFGVFGGGAILMEKFQGTGIYAMIEKYGADIAWYALFEELPFSAIMNFIALVIVVLSFITLAESLTLSLSSMTCKNYDDETGEGQPPKILNIFWGIIMAASAYILMINGGINALQTSVVICGLPSGVLLVFMMFSHVKAMHNLEKYDLSKNRTKIK